MKTLRLCVQKLSMVTIALWAMILSSSAIAHESSTAYLNLGAPVNSGTSSEITYPTDFQMALRDLALLIDIDPNRDKQVTWGEVKGQTELLQQLIAQKVELLAADNSCQIRRFDPLQINTRGGFSYLHQSLSFSCAAPIDQLNYQLLSGIDSNHRLILTQAGTNSPLQVVAVGTTPLQADSGWLTLIHNFLYSGVHHLLIGMDHLLFLFVLLIPAVYIRKKGQLTPVTRPKAALIEVFWIATAFTVAHSVTLSLAALEVVTIPARFIESVIALSIAVAALNNLIPLLRVRAIYLAFVFGLIHGFGFANVLYDLPLQTSQRVFALFSFNIGIELGQLVFICLFFPIALLVRGTAFYKNVIFIGGSLASLIIALGWFVQRAF